MFNQDTTKLHINKQIKTSREASNKQANVANFKYENVELEETKINITNILISPDYIKKESNEPTCNNDSKKVKIYPNSMEEYNVSSRNISDSIFFSKIKEEAIDPLAEIKDEYDETQITCDNDGTFTNKVVQCKFCNTSMKEEYSNHHMTYCHEKRSRIRNLYSKGMSQAKDYSSDRTINVSLDIVNLNRTNTQLTLHLSNPQDTKDVENNDLRCKDKDVNQNKYDFLPFSYKIKSENSLEKKELDAYRDKENYKCTYCSYQTAYKGYFRRHITAHNDVKKAFSYLNAHRDVNEFECDFCKKKFTQKCHLRRHVKERHTDSGVKDFMCSQCGYQTNRRSHLEQHLNTHTDVKSFECNFCNKGFSEKHKLKLHIRNKHTEGVEKDYKCTKCSYQTNTKCEFQNHVNTHSAVKPYVCDLCQRGFNQKSQMKLHKKDKHSEGFVKDFRCPQCNYQTNKKSNFRNHLATHSDAKTYECDICRQKFKTTGTLRKHKRKIHEYPTTKEHKCHQCSYRSNRKSNLRTHLRIHSDVKLFECDICHIGFNHRVSLKSHMKNKHS